MILPHHSLKMTHTSKKRPARKFLNNQAQHTVTINKNHTKATQISIQKTNPRVHPQRGEENLPRLKDLPVTVPSFSAIVSTVTAGRNDQQQWR